MWMRAVCYAAIIPRETSQPEIGRASPAQLEQCLLAERTTWMTHLFHHLARRRVASSILIICAALFASGGLFATIALLPRPVKAAGEGVPLLLVSGFAPTECSGDP